MRIGQEELIEKASAMMQGYATILDEMIQPKELAIKSYLCAQYALTRLFEELGVDEEGRKEFVENTMPHKMSLLTVPAN